MPPLGATIMDGTAITGRPGVRVPGIGIRLSAADYLTVILDCHPCGFRGKTEGMVYGVGLSFSFHGIWPSLWLAQFVEAIARLCGIDRILI